MAQNISEQDYNIDERISAYLRGKMNTSEENKFLEELKSDSELRERTIAAAQLARAMKSVGLQNDRMVEDAMLSADKAAVEKIAVTASTKQKPRILKFRGMMWALSAAACIAVIVIAGINLQTRNATIALGDDYYHDITFENVRGAEDEKIVEELSSLFTNVESGTDKKETLDRLKVLWTVATLDTYNDYTDYAPEIGWNLTIAFLKDNNREAALLMLSDLRTHFADNAGYIQQVNELEAKIKDL